MINNNNSITNPSNTINQYSRQDLISQCHQHMLENGFDCGDVITDEKIHRFSIDDKKNKPDEWYIAHEGISSKGNVFLIVNYGSWSSDKSFTFKSWNSDNEFDKDDINEINDQFKVKKNQILTQEQNKAAIEANKIWDDASHDPIDGHLIYSTMKGVEPLGVKFGKNLNGYYSLILSIINTDGDIRSLQYISCNEGKSYKTFFSGGEKKGNFHIIDNKQLQGASEIFVVEGWATGMSVYQGLEKNVAVIVALDAGNIMPVVEKIKEKFPNTLITIAGDSDKTGIAAAHVTAKQFGCSVVFPHPEEDELKDFNDLHQIKGIEEVKKQLKENVVKVIGIQEELKTISENLLKKDEPCKNFSVDLLPEALREYIKVICSTTDADPIIITCSVLSMVSAFIGKKVYLPKGDYFQDLRPNLWILCISDSGYFKTTALNNGASIALKKKELINWQINDLKKNGEIKGYTEDEIKSEILKLSVQDIVLPHKTTGEALIEHLSQGHYGVIYASEFGTFLQNLNKSHNNDFMGVITDLYDVPKFWRSKTKTQGDFILESPCFSICGVSTLDWLKPNFAMKDVGGGFFPRFLFFVCSDSDKIPAGLPRSKISITEYEEKFENEFNRILKIIGEQKRYRLSEEAKVLFDNDNPEKILGFHQQIHIMGKSYQTSVLSPFVRRWSPYLLKLAMIMQIFIDPEDDEISAHALYAALSILIPAIKSTAKLLEGELTESEFERKVRMVFNYICKRCAKTGQPVTRQTILMSKQIKAGKAKDYDEVLEFLIQRGDINKRKGKEMKLDEYEPVVPTK